jgi:hypothetical protein
MFPAPSGQQRYMGRNPSNMIANEAADRGLSAAGASLSPGLLQNLLSGLQGMF